MCQNKLFKNKEKKQIKEVIIVEGKTDTNRLQSLFNVDTIETNGSVLKKETINLIQLVAKKRGVILFLDPDYMGEKIRKQLVEHLESCKQAFIDFKDWKSKKHGVNEASDQAIIDAITNACTFNKKEAPTLNWTDYLKLNLDTKLKRAKLCQALHISYANHKQLFKRLNMIGKTYNQLKELIYE